MPEPIDAQKMLMLGQCADDAQYGMRSIIGNTRALADSFGNTSQELREAFQKLIDAMLRKPTDPEPI